METKHIEVNPVRRVVCGVQEMLEPEAVTTIVRLGQSGWGAKRIARTLGIARNTVRRYLNAGFYQPIAALVSRAVLANLPTGRAAACLDAGCGEGYYLRELAAAAGDGQHLALLGLDISKWAVLAAAKQDRRPNWVVGSNAKLPVLPATLDRVLCMFGFPVYAEFARVLKIGGVLLQVDAGADHLRELREIIYPTLKAERTSTTAIPDGFTLEATESVRYALDLVGQQQIADLLLQHGGLLVRPPLPAQLRRCMLRMEAFHIDPAAHHSHRAVHP